MVQDTQSYAADLAVSEDTVAAAYDGRDVVEAASRSATREEIPKTIGEVAREFGMTLRALRFYESKHLVTPLRRGATRLYRQSDRERIALVLTGRRLGFTLAEIKDLAARPDGKNLQLSRETCVMQINLLERQKRGIEVAIAELRQIYSSFYTMLLHDRRSC